MLSVNDFVKLREKDWKRLQELIRRRNGRETLTAAEVRELGTLYRAVNSDLAQARRDYKGQKVTLFLNQLLTRAHNYIYQPNVSDWRSIPRYFTQTLPQTFRQTWIFTLTAFLLFAVPAVVGYRLAYTNPDVAEPLDLVYIRETLADNETWTDIPLEERPYASAFIMSNNIRVSLLAFGGGMLFGLFSVYMLVVNGLMIGAVMGLAAHYGMGSTLVEFVIGHGVIELSVIFIAGGAGLQLGWALLNPGSYTRRDSLSLAGRRVIPLVIAAFPLLIIAGLIEGFISPSDATLAESATIGVVSGILLYGYLLLVGRQNPTQSFSRLNS
jgi:uncharacterized membrane protein SpoIIM required for sporulation